MEFLCEYDFEVKYIQGKENMVANALSRRRHVTLSLTLSVDLRSCILQALLIDTWYQEMRMEIDSRRPLEGRFLGYVLESYGLLHYSGMIYVQLLDELRTLILSEAHNAPYSTHPCVKKMHADFQHLYYWIGMKCDITDFVARCLECQRVKVEH